MSFAGVPAVRASCLLVESPRRIAHSLQRLGAPGVQPRI